MSSWLPNSAAGRRWLGLAPTYFVVGVFMLVPMIIMGVFFWGLDMFLLWATRILTGQGG